MAFLETFSCALQRLECKLQIFLERGKGAESTIFCPARRDDPMKEDLCQTDMNI